MDSTSNILVSRGSVRAGLSVLGQLRATYPKFVVTRWRNSSVRPDGFYGVSPLVASRTAGTVPGKSSKGIQPVFDGLPFKMRPVEKDIQ